MNRDWQLPSFLEQAAGGVRVRPGEANVPWRALIPVAVLVAYLTVWVSDVWPWHVAVAAVSGMVLGGLLVITAAPLVMWWRRRGDLIPARDVRATAGVEVGVALLAAIGGAASAIVAAVEDVQAGQVYAAGGDVYRAVAWAAVALSFGLGATAAWLLRVAWRVDARATAGGTAQGGATAAARSALPGGRPAAAALFGAEAGAVGARFPNVLPVAIALPVLAVAWSAPLIADIASGGPALARSAGLSVGLVPLWAGITWWPWLRAACSTGLRPGQVRAAGVMCLVGGVVAGSAFAGCMIGFGLLASPAAGGSQRVIAGVFFGPLFGALLAVPGWMLLSYARRLRRLADPARA